MAQVSRSARPQFGATHSANADKSDDRLDTGPKGRVHSENFVVECEILSISAAGARLKLGLNLQSDGPVQLVIDGVGTIEGTTAWQDGDIIALEFAPQSAKAAQFLKNYYRLLQGSEDKRKFPRRPVLWRGHLENDGLKVDCTIWNISRGGARITLKQHVDFNNGVVLTIDRFGSMPCEIAWVRNADLGLQFRTDPKEICESLAESLVSLGLYSSKSKPLTAKPLTV
jgi:PilZ domain